MTREQVTWLIPVRNGGRYLEATLASIVAQTYPLHQVLVWDNGSTDGTLDILHRWIGARLPGRVISDQPLGLGASLARLVELADTELCARIDADDINLPHRLEQQVAFMREHPNVALLGTQVHVIDEHGHSAEQQWSHPCEDAEIRWRMRVASSMMHPTVMFRRSAILSVGNYRDIKPGQDYDLWLRVAAKHRVANLPDQLVQYRKHEDTVSHQSQVRGYVTNRQLVERYVAELFPGIAQADALRLHSLLTTDTAGCVKWRDVMNLRRTAIQAARKSGEQGHYFRQTPRYRLQWRSLLSRCVRQQVGLLNVDATFDGRPADNTSTIEPTTPVTSEAVTRRAA